MRTLIGFKRVVFAAVAAMGVSAFGEGEEPADAKVSLQLVSTYWEGGEKDPHRLTDGVRNYFGFYGYDSVREFVFDMGGQKSLTRMRACSSWTGRFDLSFWVSATGKDDDWSLFLRTQSSMSTGDYTWVESSVPEELADLKFRYVKIKSENGVMPGCSEMEFYSNDQSLTFLAPSTWASANSVNTMQPEGEKGIEIRGTYTGPGGEASKIYCYVANKDLGENYGEWKSKGQEFLLAEDVIPTSGGTSFCGYLTDLKKGYYYLRVFAVAGEKVDMAGALRYVASKAVPASTVRAYMTSNAAGANSKTWVDGVYNGSRLEIVSGQDPNYMNIWTVFDLKKYNEAGLYVSGVRLFSRNSPGRRLGAKIEWAYDDPENPAVWKVESNLYTSEDGTRTLDYVPLVDLPELTWQSAGDCEEYRDDPRLNENSVIELTIFPEAQKSLVKTYHRTGKLPRYLRVGKIQSNDVVEFELRLSKIPPEGMAILVR